MRGVNPYHRSRPGRSESYPLVGGAGEEVVVAVVVREDAELICVDGAGADVVELATGLMNAGP